MNIDLMITGNERLHSILNCRVLAAFIRTSAPMRLLVRVSAAVAFLFAPISTTWAQTQGPLLGVEIPFDMDRGRNISVTQRPKPELEPQGIPAGAFRLYPTVTAGLRYSSNVYGLTDNGVGDLAVTARPQLELRSNWSNHYARIRASGNFERFLSETIRNQNGYAVTAEGRVDITRSSSLYAYGSIERTYEEQYSGSFPANSAGPVPLTRITAIMRGTHEFNRFRLTVNGDITSASYSDNLSLSGTMLDQSFRDRSIMRASARGEYALTPDTALFLQTTYANSDYTHILVGQPQRDSKEVRTLAGLTFDLGSLIRAAIGVGYVRRDYTSSYYPTLSNVAADIRVEYFLSPLTTLTASGTRRIDDSVVGNSPGFVATNIGLRADHELLRNLILNVDGQYERDNFSNITRRDTQYRLNAGAQYIPWRNIVLEPQISYIDRKSRGEFNGPSFSEFQALIKVSYRL